MGGSVQTQRLERIAAVWALAVCAYVFFMPVSNNIVLMPLVATLGIVAVYWFLTRGVRLARKVLLPGAIWVAFVIYGSVTAWISGAESWLRVMVFMLAIPLFYFLMVSVFRRAFIKPLLTTGLVVSMAISVLLISQMLAAMGILPFLKLPFAAGRFLGLVVEVDPNGPLRFTTNILPPLLWWGAIWMASIFVSKADQFLPPRWLRVIATALCFSAAVFSLRRAVILALVLTPVVTLAAALFLYVRNRSQRDVRLTWRNALMLVGAIAAAVAIVIGVQPKSYEIVSASISSIIAVTTQTDVVIGESTPPSQSDDEDIPGAIEDPLISDGSNLGVKSTYDTIRQNEARILLSPESPVQALFGSGIGATVDRGDYVREGLKDRPWQSDLPYHLTFYWTGFVGVALVVAVAVTGLLALRAAMRRAGELNGVLLVATVGAVALLVANASNPYMQALGHLWPLFFPFMIANVVLSERSEPESVLVVPPWLGLRRSARGLPR